MLKPRVVVRRPDGHQPHSRWITCCDIQDLIASSRPLFHVAAVVADLIRRSAARSDDKNGHSAVLWKGVRDLGAIATDRSTVIVWRPRHHGLGGRSQRLENHAEPAGSTRTEYQRGAVARYRRLVIIGRVLGHPFQRTVWFAGVRIERHAPDVRPHRAADEHHATIRGHRRGGLVGRAEGDTLRRANDASVRRRQRNLPDVRRVADGAMKEDAITRARPRIGKRQPLECLKPFAHERGAGAGRHR